MTPYQLAERFIGIKEIPGSKDNHQVLAMLKLDADWPEHDEVPWCSAFVNYIAWLCRLPRSKSLMAQSWLEVGIPIQKTEAKAGFDIVILSRPNETTTAGHVGFFSSLIGSKVYILGGNQSDKINVCPFLETRILGIRKLT